MCKRIRVYFLTNLSIANLQEMLILLKIFCLLQKIFLMTSLIQFYQYIQQWESEKFKPGVYNRVDRKSKICANC